VPIVGLFDYGGRFYHVTYLSDSSDQLAVTIPMLPCEYKQFLWEGTLIQLVRQFAVLHSDKKQISVGIIGYQNTEKFEMLLHYPGRQRCGNI